MKINLYKSIEVMMKRILFILSFILICNAILLNPVFAEKHKFIYKFKDGDKFNLNISGRSEYMNSGNDGAQKVTAKSVFEVERKTKKGFTIKTTCLFVDKKDAFPEFNVTQLHMSDSGVTVKNNYDNSGKNISKKFNKNSGMVLINFPEKAISPGYTWKHKEKGKFDFGLVLLIEMNWTLEKIVTKGSRKLAYFKAIINIKSSDRTLISRGTIKIIHDMNTGLDIKGVYDVEHQYSGNGVSQTTGQYREWEIQKVKVQSYDDWN